ncbi:hypothetical protein ACFQJD_06935 [Haloplanus sp. GCM10025708]
MQRTRRKLLDRTDVAPVGVGRAGRSGDGEGRTNDGTVIVEE